MYEVSLSLRRREQMRRRKVEGKRARVPFPWEMCVARSGLRPTRGRLRATPSFELKGGSFSSSAARYCARATAPAPSSP